RRILERVDPDLVSHAGRIGNEFLEGFKLVDEIGGPGVTIFGSARITSSHAIYERARETGRLFAQRGFAVITGGGPGVMEAANRREAGADCYERNCAEETPAEPAKAGARSAGNGLDQPSVFGDVRAHDVEARPPEARGAYVDPEARRQRRSIRNPGRRQEVVV